VQVIVGNMLWEPALQMSRGMQAAGKDQGVHVQLYDAHGDIDLDVSMVEQLPASNARGAIIVSLSSPRFSQAIYKLQLQNYPFVLLDQQMRDIEVSAVTSDNHAGGYLAGQHLVGLGHQKIAFIGDLIAASVQARLTGLRDAIGDAGVPFRREMVVDLVAGSDRFGDWTECVSAGVNRLMSLPERPTAIFCSCDGVARLAYRALAAMKIHVPTQVSVVGYDDDPLAEWLAPSLTTVRQPFAQMGEAAMELLEKRIADPTAPAEFRRMPVELVVRHSTTTPGNSLVAPVNLEA
jgi:DNA-binding LacI/PurR family transcriptional regulator